jgi:hypothetical protein
MTTSPDQTFLARTFEDGRYAWTRTRVVVSRCTSSSSHDAAVSLTG